jgi:hypothetical protein
MKGVTFVIILSVVWSIVSSIIEKRKAAAKKEAGRVDLSGQAIAQRRLPHTTPECKNCGPKTLKAIRCTF